MGKTVSFSELVEKIFDQIDISPTQYKEAVSHYRAVSGVLVDGEAGTDIYVQGSFSLGTVTRPFKGGKDADFDLDIVCQGKDQKASIEPKQLKNRVKECILASPHHSRLLDKDEGRRCWTLNYTPDASGVGFHMDILPCVSESTDIVNAIKPLCPKPEYADSAIAITDKDKILQTYGWSSGNPRGYARWFLDINAPYLIPVVNQQKLAFIESGAFASIAEVPDPLLKSPLQRAIQLLKRHRDCRFDGRSNADDKPISIIITTLAAQIAKRYPLHVITTQDMLTTIIRGLKQYARLLESNFEDYARMLPRDYFTRTQQKGWEIPNPVNCEENFAERWGENNDAKARAFFQWVDWVASDFDFDGKDSGAVFSQLQSGFGSEMIRCAYQSLELNPIHTPTIITASSLGAPPKPYLLK